MKDLIKESEKRGIKYLLISFVDLFGILRAKLVPREAIGKMQKEGAGFAGFATWLDMTPAHPDMFGLPDPDSLIQLPWNKEVGWLASDLYMDGKPVEASPRVLLKNQINQANRKNYRFKSGVECEYFLLEPEGNHISDARDIQEKPCYDQQALMRRYEVIKEICNSMLEMGWNPYQNDHEDANGQFEMNWDYADVLTTADRHVFFKFMVKSIAEKNGLRATFMPKPFSHLTGNGCHAHVSVWDKSGKTNLFKNNKDKLGLGLSQLAYHALGGILTHTPALTAIFNPTVNSYKRINAGSTTSGATWAPNTVTYSGNNRTHMIRIPDHGRFELRLMDGSSNPYLMQAGIIMATLDGIDCKYDPGKPLDINMYTEAHKVKNSTKELPLNLLDAIRLFKKNKKMRDIFGDTFVDSYSKLKMKDWNAYANHVSKWEREHLLDC